MDERAYWVGFNLVKGIGSVRMQLLQNAFGDLQTAWKAPSEKLIAAGLNPKIAQNLIAVRKTVDLEQYWEQIHKQGIRVLIREDEDYPERLREIDQPPPVLYMRGTLQSEDCWAVAIVGTRRITAYGRQIAEELGSFLARNGITVVSGLARGVDAVAHDAALKAGGRTLAVLGCGVDRIYPPEHARLAERMIAQGAILSDYAPGTPPDSANFPPRNRIISGLSLGVVVVEAGDESGALITATFAAEQGREVFAVPGNILAPQSKGANRLIQEGAHPVLNGQDILEILHLTRVDQQRSARKTLPADAMEARLIDVLGYEPIHIDDIRERADLPIEKVSATLTIMELKGMVRQVSPLHYVIARELRADYSTD
ncbi:MAG: DNA-processing protein DprA [Chloroflexi bacterium]|nr:DNA-processing protein DprA [Chloroflexota bacterium]